MSAPPTTVPRSLTPYAIDSRPPRVPRGVIAPPDHPLAGEQQIPLRKLHKETFIERERGSGTRLARERFFAAHGAESFGETMEMSSNEAIKQAVQAGLGLGVLSLHTLELELILKRLVVLDVENFPIMRHWFIIHRQGKRFSTVAEAFKQFVLTESQSLLTVPSAETAA